MQNFEDMPANDRFAIPQQRKNAQFLAQRSTLGFEDVERNLPRVNLAEVFEVPPSPVILTKECLAQVFVYTRDDWKGRWNRFFILTYFYEGRIKFKRVADDQFLVDVVFD